MIEDLAHGPAVAAATLAALLVLPGLVTRIRRSRPRLLVCGHPAPPHKRPVSGRIIRCSASPLHQGQHFHQHPDTHVRTTWW